MDSAPSRPRQRALDAAAGLLAGAGAVAAVTAVVAVLDRWVPPLSLGALYVLAVLPVAIAWGALVAVPVAVGSMLAFNFFELPPRHTLHLREGEDWLALVVYLAVAVAASWLAGRARRREREAAARERETALLADAAARLLGAGDLAREAVCRILVSDVHGASLRALAFARTLGIEDARAVFFAFDAVEAKRLRSDWERRGIDIPLEVHEAPYRDLGDPLRTYLRALTGEDKVVVVVMPELVVDGWRRLLHNQRALYVKRLLLFEPHVILSSVPYRLR